MSTTIAILGAGFGGLRAAKLLARSLRRGQLPDCRIVLVDRNDFHGYAPLFYELSASPEQIARHFDLPFIVTFPLDKILGKLPVERLHDTVRALDLPNGRVILASGSSLDYDYLIVALGTEPDFADIPGMPRRR